MLFFLKAYFGQKMLFYYRNMLLIFENMLLFLKNTKICTYIPKISKKSIFIPSLIMYIRDLNSFYVVFLEN